MRGALLAHLAILTGQTGRLLLPRCSLGISPNPSSNFGFGRWYFPLKVRSSHSMSAPRTPKHIGGEKSNVALAARATLAEF